MACSTSVAPAGASSEVSGSVGRVSAYPDAVADYAHHLTGTIARRLDGLTVVLDCAEGAAYDVGPQALREAGARTVLLGPEVMRSSTAGPAALAVLSALVGRWG